MKDANFLNSIRGSFVVDNTAKFAIANWVDDGGQFLYLPARMLGLSYFISIYRSQFVEHFMECAKTRNWRYRTVENLVPIDWRTNLNGIRIESRKPY